MTNDDIRTSRRTILFATGIVAGNAFAAGCLGDDTDATDNGTVGKNTATRTPTETGTPTDQPEYENDTGTDAETTKTDIRGDPEEASGYEGTLLEERAVKQTKYLRHAAPIEDHFYAANNDLNEWWYEAVGDAETGGTLYDRIVDVWADDSVDDFSNYSEEELLTRDDIGDTLAKFIGSLSADRFLESVHAETDHDIRNHVYRVHQGSDRTPPRAVAVVPPLAGETIVENASNNRIAARTEATRAYLLDQEDRFTVEL